MGAEKMKIRYYSYTEEIIENIEAGKIHIFPKSVDKSLAKERYLEGLEKFNFVAKKSLS